MTTTVSVIAMYLLNNLVQIIQGVFFLEQILKIKTRFSIMCGAWLGGMMAIYLFGYFFSIPQSVQSVLRIFLGLVMVILFSCDKLGKRLLVFLLFLSGGYIAELICFFICSKIYNISINDISIYESHSMFVMLLAADFLFLILLIMAVVWKRKELLLQKNFGKLGIMLLFTSIHIVILCFIILTRQYWITFVTR